MANLESGPTTAQSAKEAVQNITDAARAYRCRVRGAFLLTGYFIGEAISEGGTWGKVNLSILGVATTWAHARFSRQEIADSRAAKEAVVDQLAREHEHAGFESVDAERGEARADQAIIAGDFGAGGMGASLALAEGAAQAAGVIGSGLGVVAAEALTRRVENQTNQILLDRIDRIAAG